MTKSEKRSLAVLILIIVIDIFCVFGLYCTRREVPPAREASIELRPIVYDRTVTVTATFDRAKDISLDQIEVEIEEPIEIVEEVVEAPAPEPEPVIYQGSSFRSDGVWYDGTYRYTWYSSNVAYHYRTPEWTAGSDGIYRDAEGYVVVASSDHPQGTVIENTPFGAAKVYDTGCASGTLDVYTNF